MITGETVTIETTVTKFTQETNSVTPTNFIERKWSNYFTKWNRRNQRN